MKPELIELISNARRDLRRASGLPLTTEEIEQVRLEKEMKALEKLLFDRVPLNVLLPLRFSVTAHNGRAVAWFPVDENTFHLGPDGQELQLALVHEKQSKEAQDKDLLRLKRDDPQFVNRLLVVIGDEVAGRGSC